MSQRHAELFEIGVGYFMQNFRVDFALAKDRFILAEAKATKPIPHAHGQTPTRERRLSGRYLGEHRQKPAKKSDLKAFAAPTFVGRTT